MPRTGQAHGAAPVIFRAASFCNGVRRLEGRSANAKRGPPSGGRVHSAGASCRRRHRRLARGRPFGEQEETFIGLPAVIADTTLNKPVEFAFVSKKIWLARQSLFLAEATV